MTSPPYGACKHATTWEMSFPWLTSKQTHIQERIMEVLLWFSRRSTFTEEPASKWVNFWDDSRSWHFMASSSYPSPRERGDLVMPFIYLFIYLILFQLLDTSLVWIGCQLLNSKTLNINSNSYSENSITKYKVQHCELIRLSVTSQYFNYTTPFQILLIRHIPNLIIQNLKLPCSSISLSDWRHIS